MARCPTRRCSCTSSRYFSSASRATFPAKRGRLAPRFNGTLSPLLANSMASLAARYSQSSDVLARGATAMSNAYGDAAKVCPPSLPSLASLLRSDHGFTHSASSTTVPIFRTSRFSTLSSSSPSGSHLHVIYLEYLRVTNAIGHIQLAIVCWKDGSFGGLGSAASLGLPYAWTHSNDHRPTVSGGSRQKNKASLSPTDGWDDEDAALSQGVAKKKKARSQANSDNKVCLNIFSLALVSPLMSYMRFLGVLRSPHPYLETLRPIRSTIS